MLTQTQPHNVDRTKFDRTTGDRTKFEPANLTVPEATKNTWVIGYYPWYEAADVSPATFPYTWLTHVAIGNAFVTDTGCCTPPPGSETTWAAYASATVAERRMGFVVRRLPIATRRC